MAKALQRRRGTHEEHQNFTGLVGEFTYDTTEKRIVAHDGATAGGIPMAKKSEVDAIDVGVTSFNGAKGAVTYSAPVSSVNGQTGAVTVNVGVTSFNGSTGAVTYSAPVTSVNGQTGAVTISVPVAPKAYVTETWKNGTSWYRKWSDGLIEQYLSYTSTSEVVWSKDITVTLPTSMTTTNYKAVACLQGDQSRLELGLSAHSKTKTTVTFTGNSMSYGFDIYIVGY